MSARDSLRPAGWQAGLPEGAGRLRSAGRAADLLRREVDALRAELAGLVDLDAGGLWEDRDPLAGLAVRDPAAVTATSGRPGHGAPTDRLAHSAGGMGGFRMPQRAPWPAGDQDGPAPHSTAVPLPEHPLSGAGGDPSPQPVPLPTAGAAEQPARPGSAAVRPNGGRAVLAGAAAQSPDDRPTSAHGAVSADTAGSLSQWAVRRRGLDLAVAARAPVGGSRLPIDRLHERARLDIAVPHGRQATDQLRQYATRESTGGSDAGASPDLPAVSMPMRSLEPGNIPAGQGATESPLPGAGSRAPHAGPDPPDTPSPAADLLARLTERWFVARPPIESAAQPVVERTGAPRRPDQAGAATGHAAHAGAGPERTGRHEQPQGWAVGPEHLRSDRVASSEHQPWTQLTGMRDEQGAAHAEWRTAAAYNTINLTVHPPPALEALDADDLADLLDRILRREARRHGISLL
jgi:hypothetical protein